MKLKTMAYFTALASGCILLAGCSTLKSDIAQMQKHNLTRTLPNGTKVHFLPNLAPTKTWGCHRVAKPIFYNWAKVQRDGAFKVGGAYEVLMDHAEDYIKAHHYKANYVNMTIPKTKSDSISIGDDVNFSFRKNRYASVGLYFYNCKRIDPNNTIAKGGAVSRTSYSIGGSGSDVGF